jgi:hypothetical protein
MKPFNITYILNDGREDYNRTEGIPFEGCLLENNRSGNLKKVLYHRPSAESGLSFSNFL